MTKLREKEGVALSELGKQSVYEAHYHPEKLFAISRKEKRDEIGVPEILPFYGYDLWNHYEVSWLNEKGKPLVAIAEITYPCDSPNIIESKSMKLFFNSLNNSKFKNAEEVQAILTSDLQQRVGAPVKVRIMPLKEEKLLTGFMGECIDDQDITCETYLVDPYFLQTNQQVVEESLYSNLLKSNCLVTGQPDWGSVQIIYKGKQIQREGLLKYLVSFRNHNEFHEQCIERIFMDIMRQCQPQSLTVYGRYTRRGGLDINPYRSTENVSSAYQNQRLCRQ